MDLLLLPANGKRSGVASVSMTTRYELTNESTAAWDTLSKKQKEKQHEFHKSQTVNEKSLSTPLFSPLGTTFPRISYHQDSGFDASKGNFSFEVWKAKRSSHFSAGAAEVQWTFRSWCPIKNHFEVAMASLCFLHFQTSWAVLFWLWPPDLIMDVQASNSRCEILLSSNTWLNPYWYR